MAILFAFVITTIAAIEAAGYFLKFNKNLTAGARTLFIMGAIWFAIKANHHTDLPQPTPHQVIAIEQ